MPTAYDLAEYMIEDRLTYVKEGVEDYVKWCKNKTNCDPRLIKQQEEYLNSIEERTKILKENLKKITDKDANFTFASTNFSTFITKVIVENESFLYVATCNNVQWSVPKCLLSILGEEGDIYDGLYDRTHIYDKEFIDLDKNKTIYISNLDDMLNT